MQVLSDLLGEHYAPGAFLEEEAIAINHLLRLQSFIDTDGRSQFGYELDCLLFCIAVKGQNEFFGSHHFVNALAEGSLFRAANKPPRKPGSGAHG